MKKPKDSPYLKGFGELDDLKNNEIPRPKLKQENEITAMYVIEIEKDGKYIVKVVAWYDNETGYTSQMIRTLENW